MSVPNATLFAPIVSATFDTSALPSILNDPVTSPVAKVTVLAVCHFDAVAALPVTSPVTSPVKSPVTSPVNTASVPSVPFSSILLVPLEAKISPTTSPDN